MPTEKCPTCGSDRYGEKRIRVNRTTFLRTTQDDGSPCPDRWHNGGATMPTEKIEPELPEAVDAAITKFGKDSQSFQVMHISTEALMESIAFLRRQIAAALEEVRKERDEAVKMLSIWRDQAFAECAADMEQLIAALFDCDDEVDRRRKSEALLDRIAAKARDGESSIPEIVKLREELDSLKDAAAKEEK